MKIMFSLCRAASLVFLCAMCIVGISSGYAQNIAVVNGKAIPAAWLNVLVQQQKQQGQEDTPEIRNLLKDELINRAVIAQEAERLGLSKDVEVSTQMEIARQNILIRALGNDFKKKNKVSEADVRKEYDAYSAKATGKEYRSRHVLVETADKASDVIKQIRGGAKMEDIASKTSIDKGSAANGGDLGWAPPTAYVKSFADALVALTPGQMTDQPVKSDFGYHVIRLEEVRDANVMAYDDVKGQIEASLMERKLREYQKTLREKAKVK